MQTKRSCLQNIIKSCLVAFFLGLSSHTYGQVSTEGRDFWFSFMNNWLEDANNPIILEVYISAADSTSGTLSIPKDGSFTPVNFTVVPGVTTRIPIPNRFMPAGSDAKENKALHIVTGEDVSVFAMNTRQFSADMTVILPTYSLGNKYMVLSYWENDNRDNNNNSNSEFVVASIADGTQIEIKPAVQTLGGKAANVPFKITLNQGEVYEIQGRGDLTGTTVTATNPSGGCQNFALFAGNQYTKVGPCASMVGHDHIYAQQYPIDTWGTEFITVGVYGHANGDVIKVLASQNNTTVTINSDTYTLSMGQSLLLTLAGVNIIKSDKPVAVGQFCRSQGCNGELGDPFYIVISPVEQMLKKITFDCPAIQPISEYPLTIITRTAETSGMQLDNKSITSNFKLVPGDPDYSYAQVLTFTGSHTLESTGRFIAYINGFGDHQSFGYSAGVSLENLNIDVLVSDETGHLLPSDNICHNDKVLFTPVVDDRNRFEWSFSDGHTVTTTNTDPIEYQFAKEGKYILTLKVSIGGGNCIAGTEDTYVKVINVVNPKSKILGPRSVCPNTEDVLYTVDKIRPYYYNWSQSGGAIDQNLGDSVTIDWGASNANAYVRLQAHNDFNCYGDPVTQPVTINVKLHPEAPFGPDTLCSNDMKDKIYSSYYIKDYNYDWHISPGIINTGQGSNVVDVDWTTHGIGKIWFIQSASNFCDGSSDTLNVYIQRDPSPIATINTLKNIYQIGETVNLTIAADPLYQMVNWVYDDGAKLDSTVINPTSHKYRCSGTFDISINVYDTIGICPTKATGSKEIKVLPVAFEMIQVTTLETSDSTLQIVWKIENADFLDQALKLTKKAPSTDWQTLAFYDGKITATTDMLVDTYKNIYEYQLIQTSTCPDQPAIEPHNNIVLKATGVDNLSANVTWNPYVNWKNGVDHYEIYRSIDKADFVNIGTTSDNSISFPYDSMGFDYCYRIKAIELGGNESYSLSNISCASFVPQVTTYNIIIPEENPSLRNNVFHIDKIDHYPNSVLTIYNRWGTEIKRFIGYKNDWPTNSQVNDVSEGVYFFVLRLNDKRATQADIKGTISVLK